MGDHEGEFIQMPLRAPTDEHSPCDDNSDRCQATTKMASNVGGDPEIERCGCCPQACYSNNCVLINSIVLCFLMVLSIGLLVGFTVTLARPHLGALVYVNGTCRTVTSNYTGRSTLISSLMSLIHIYIMENIN